MVEAGPLLSVEDLHTHFVTGQGDVRAVDGVTLHINAGETVGLVGESGCGKSVLALSILGLVPEPGRIVGGRVIFDGENLLELGAEAKRQLRGNQLAISLQDPIAALNPLMKIGTQLKEAMADHDRYRPRQAAERVVPVLTTVGLPGARQQSNAYPHQLSGGMRQRVMIGIGIANDPRLLIADEATTALDVTAQGAMVQLLAKLNVDLGAAVLLITHNMTVVAGLSQRVIVMYAGQIVEHGPTDAIFSNPQHPYTWHLLRSVARSDIPRGRLVTIGGAPPDMLRLPGGCRFHPRCPFRIDRCVDDEPPLERVALGQAARCWVLMKNVTDATSLLDESIGVPREHGHRQGLPVDGHRTDAGVALLRAESLIKVFPRSGGHAVRAVDGVSIDIRRGETLGIIGESGSGKSTLVRMLAALIAPTAGRVLLAGRDITALKGKALRQIRRQMQVVFQDPALDPRMRVEAIVAEPLNSFPRPGSDRERVRELLDLVGLNETTGRRYPHQLSGGQRQRVGIARALALRPSLLICDEPVSSLDVSIQSQIINLLADLQRELDLTYAFVSHDLGVIRHIADRVCVMYRGIIVEVADAADIFDRPQHPYTRSLLASTPLPIPGWRPDTTGTAPLAQETTVLPSGCRYHPHCALAQVPGICDQQPPDLKAAAEETHRTACHFAGTASRQERRP